MVGRVDDGEPMVPMANALRKLIKRRRYPIEAMLVCLRWYAA